jgi:hypothetical protein
MKRLRLLLCALSLTFLFAVPVAAGCVGENIFDTLPADRRQQIEAAANAVPYPTGNFWRATRGQEVIIISGTYHFDDPRHLPNLEALTPHITSATTVLVEAGPKEEKALMELIRREPSRVLITEGPALHEKLPPELWDSLSDALARRGVPGFMAAKFKPWYVIALLAVPPCAMIDMASQPKGLDGMVIETALAANVPVKGLEPFDTIFRIFDSLTEAEMTEMLKSTLALENRSEDHARTLADSYFAGESRKIWELMRQVSYDMPGYSHAEVDTEFARMEEVLMATRNRSWIPVLTEAAARGPVFAAFGSLHLSGQEGVLNLLEAQGFALEELKL